MGLAQMSFAGGVMIAVTVLARAVFISRLPKKTFLVLWGVILFRLLIPFSLPFEGSVYTCLQRNTGGAVEKDPASETFLPVQETEMASSVTENTGTWRKETLEETSAAEDFSAPVSEILPRLAAPVYGILHGFDTALWIQQYGPLFLRIIWMAGAFSCMLFFLTAYIRCRREFRMSLPVQHIKAQEWIEKQRLRRGISIRQTDRIQAPLTYGLLHPVILVPKSLDWEDDVTVGFIMEHEVTHIRRMDILVKLVMISALCLHWFNPLVWAMYLFLNRDLELACDEIVVRRFGEDVRADYALVLISMEEKKSGLMPFCSSFGKNAIEERIGAIMKVRKWSFFTGILSVALIAGITSAFATSAATEETQITETGILETDVSEEDSEDIGENNEDVFVWIDRESQAAETLRSQLSEEIARMEQQLGQEDQNTDELIQELEALKEQREALLLRQAELSSLKELLNTYGEYGITVRFLSRDEEEYVIYLNDRPVRYLLDEENGGVIWADDENGDIVLRTVRDDGGDIVSLEETAEDSGADIPEAETDAESPSISIIGGADGPTSVFIAGKLGGEDSSVPEAVSEDEYEQYMEENSGIGEKGMSKTVKKNYVSEDEIPYALRYREYTEDGWWGGILKRTEVSPGKGSDLYEAVFEGTLYELS